MTDRRADDIPPDVHDTLTQLLAAAADALPEDDATARASLDTVSRVVANKLAESDLKDRLLHGCDAVADRLDTGDDAAAIAYLESMHDLLDRDDSPH
ncbi:hypothetical protein [Halorubellus salinus]|uniref:hypothetical protein n=1 Tax=Halorubellus salinus TaxID=755309 RepID=UPI001D0935FE|nr:hypothetical protein [Halorubellus salinus]